MRQSLHIVITLVTVAVATLAGYWVWNFYLGSAWTRDGRIGAAIVTVAPGVSGRVVAVTDRTRVKRGDMLFRIDDARYRAAAARARAVVAERRQRWALRQLEVRRLRRQQNSAPASTWLRAATIRSARAKARYQRAQAELAVQNIDLKNTTVSAPADGWVINPGLRAGDTVAQGHAVLSLVKAGSFYATGYFDETKLSLIHIGQQARIRLMAGGPALTGHVIRIARGIANTNATVNGQLLPRVSPSFSWVRLPQRIPVDIALDSVPENITLSAGMTASIRLRQNTSEQPGTARAPQP